MSKIQHKFCCKYGVNFPESFIIFYYYLFCVAQQAHAFKNVAICVNHKILSKFEKNDFRFYMLVIATIKNVLIIIMTVGLIK